MNQSEIKRQVGLNHSTQKNLAYALEAVFLIRSMYSHAGTEKSNLVYYLEDQGESYILAPEQSPIQLFEQLIYRNFRAEFFYSKVVVVTKSKNLEQIDERVIVTPAYTLV